MHDPLLFVPSALWKGTVPTYIYGTQAVGPKHPNWPDSQEPIYPLGHGSEKRLSTDTASLVESKQPGTLGQTKIPIYLCVPT